MRFSELHEGLTESDEHSPVANAITRRILLQRTDLLSKYGPALVTQAIDEVADFVGDVEEIGSSDVSGWIRQVEKMLADNPPEAFGEGGVPSTPGRAVDAKGRSQQQWLQAVRSQFPNARIIQAKMIDGPIQAILPDGRKLSWSKAVTGSSVSEAGDEPGSAKLNVEAKCKVCGTPYKVHFRFDPQGDPYGKITHTLVRGICGRVPGDFPGLNGEPVNTPSRPDPIAAMQTSLSNPRPSAPVKRLEVGSVIGYSNSRVINKPGKIIKAEVLEIGGMIGRSSVRVKLLDPQDIAANGGKLTVIISQFDIRQNPYVGESVSEDFEDLPNELMDPQAWKALDVRQKYKALVDAGLIKQDRFSSLEKTWMNDDGSDYPLDHPWAPDGLKDGSLDLNRIYRSAQADYQGRTHGSNVTSQDRENELNIGSEGRAESKRKADELAEIRREKLRNERLHDEETAFQRAETVQQREDEMKKIADQYKHDLTIIDKEHSNNMEAIKTSNKFELDKLDKEYADSQRERDFKGSETDKEYADAQRERDYKSGESDKEFRDRNADRDFRAGESDKEFRDRNADRDFRSGESDKEFRDRNQDREFKSGESDKDYRDRQREREHQQSMADKEREQSRPEPEEPRPRPRPQRPSSGAGNRFDQDTGEPTKPSKPEPQTWHTSQQVGSTAKDDEDDIEDVESRPFTPYTPRPSKPMALSAPKRESRFSEAGRYGSNNPDTMSPNNYDRYQQDQMDQGKSDFKRREHEHEWEQEKAYSAKLSARDAGTWYIRLNGKLIRDKQGNPYSFRGKAAANKAALTMQAKLFNQGKEFMLTTNPNDK